MAGEVLRYPDGSGRSLSEVLEACEAGAVVEVAPGRYVEALVLTKPVTLRGAGDLTRLSLEGQTLAVRVATSSSDPVRIESILIEGGAGDRGGAISLVSGRLEIHNVHIRGCTGSSGGGAIHLATGSLDATLLRIHEVTGDRGGAICAMGDARVVVRDSQISEAEARYGGALAFLGPVRARFEGVTIGRSRATVMAGGQAIYAAGAGDGRPEIELLRVRLEDAPLGMPVVVDREHGGTISLEECDMPRVVLDVKGVVDAGHNTWR